LLGQDYTTTIPSFQQLGVLNFIDSNVSLTLPSLFTNAQDPFIVMVDEKPLGVFLPNLLENLEINSLNVLYSGCLLTMVPLFSLSHLSTLSPFSPLSHLSPLPSPSPLSLSALPLNVGMS